MRGAETILRREARGIQTLESAADRSGDLSAGRPCYKQFPQAAAERHGLFPRRFILIRPKNNSWRCKRASSLTVSCPYGIGSIVALFAGVWNWMNSRLTVDNTSLLECLSSSDEPPGDRCVLGGSCGGLFLGEVNSAQHEPRLRRQIYLAPGMSS